MISHHVHCLLALAAVVLSISPASAGSVTYVSEGVLSLESSNGLGDPLGFNGAHVRIEVDLDLDSEPVFPTVANPVGTGPNVGRFPIGETRAYFTLRAAGRPDAQIQYPELGLGAFQTINEASGQDSFIVAGQGNDSGSSALDGLYVSIPHITATLSQPYSEFTSFGSNSPIGRIPDLSIAGIDGVSAGMLQVLMRSADDSPPLYSRYSISGLTLISIPEPSALIGLGLGMGLLAFRRKQTNRLARTLPSVVILMLGALTSSSAEALDTKHCWNLSACPGSAPVVSNSNPTFVTYLDTNTHPLGHCATVWVIHYNDAIVIPIDVEKVINPFDDSDFLAYGLDSAASLSNPNAECLTCDRDLTVVWEDRFDNGFQLPVTNPNAEVKVTWQLIATPPTTIFLDGIDGAESAWNASHVCLTSYINTDTFGTLTVPEPDIAASLGASTLAIAVSFGFVVRSSVRAMRTRAR